MDRDLLALQEVRDLVRAAKEAQGLLDRFTQADVDRICLAMVEAGEKAAQPLAQLAVEETTYGRVESKVQKNLVATRMVWDNIKDMKTVGIISRDDARGLYEIAEPVGVIAAVIPTTNPTSTTMFKIISSIKSRNAVVVSPHPRAKQCINDSARILNDAALKAGCPPGAIGCITDPTIDATNALMKHPDVSLILSTGGPGIVKAAYSSGKPAYGVGAGNCPAYIDRTADVQHAVSCLIDSQTFDWGTICASEQSVIVDQPVAKAVRDEFVRQGGYFCSPSEVQALSDLICVPGGMSPKVVGQAPTKLAQMAGFNVPVETNVLLAPMSGVGKEHPLSREKLCPVLTYYEVNGWQQGCERCLEVLAYGGTGHSLAIHATDEKTILEFAMKKPAFRLMVNCPTTQGSVGYATHMNPSMTLGCGTPGNNITSDNITARHLINVKRLAFIRPDYHLGAPHVQFKADEHQVSGFVPFAGGSGTPAPRGTAGGTGGSGGTARLSPATGGTGDEARAARARAATGMAAPAGASRADPGMLSTDDIQKILARVSGGRDG